MRDYREKPKGDQIRISLDSGAHCNSRHDVICDPPELGFATKADWDAADDEEKMKAVQEYFSSNGFPEFSWDDAESCR